MFHWWKRHRNIELGDYTESEVEDLTGCIPLLLNNCVVDKKINVKNPFFKDIYLQAMTFEREIKTKCSPTEYEEYAKLVLTPQNR